MGIVVSSFGVVNSMSLLLFAQLARLLVAATCKKGLNGIDPASASWPHQPLSLSDYNPPIPTYLANLNVK